VIETPAGAVVPLDELYLVAVRVRHECVARVLLGRAVVLDTLVHQPVVGFGDVFDADGDVTPGVAHLVGSAVVVVGQLQQGAVIVDVLRPEEDVGECLGLPAPLLLVVEVGLVPVEGLVEVFDTDHRMVDSKRHTGIDGRTAENVPTAVGQVTERPESARL